MGEQWKFAEFVRFRTQDVLRSRWDEQQAKYVGACVFDLFPI